MPSCRELAVLAHNPTLALQQVALLFDHTRRRGQAAWAARSAQNPDERAVVSENGHAGTRAVGDLIHAI
jgi:hypothetical protein